jgi:ribonucleotide reductase beta subunit family protein with ferritin-like domain
VLEAARKIYEHEKAIIAKIFAMGPIEGVTVTQLEHFVEHRINVCLQGLGMQNLFEVNYNPIGDWFYKNINGYKSVDFFARQGKEYSRNWNEKKFTW